MKSLNLLLLLPFLFAGCADIKESECPSDRDNLTVKFSLKNKDGREILPSMIDNVEFFVYNRAGFQVRHSSMTKDELDLFAGVKYQIEPGDYTLVGWANFKDCSTQLFTNPDAAYLSQADNYVISSISNGSGDYSDCSPLYYSARQTPITVTVPSEGVTEVTAPFKHAHIKVEVAIKGYISTRGAAEPLTVEITDLIPFYGFDLSAFGAPVCYRQSAAIVGQDYHVLFNTPLFDRTTAMQVKVTKSDGSLITPAIRIADLIIDEIDLDEVSHLPIVITFNGTQVDVAVNLPGWGDDPITGEI